MNQGKAKTWSPLAWQKQLYQGIVEHKSLAEMKEILESQEHKGPDAGASDLSDKVFSFVANRSYSHDSPIRSTYLSAPESDIPDLDVAIDYRQHGVKRLQLMVKADIEYNLAAAIHQTNTSKFDAKQLDSALQVFPREVRDNFSQNLPQLHESFAATLTQEKKNSFFALVPATQRFSEHYALAAAIRQENASGLDVERFNQAILPLSESARLGFSYYFPDLHASFAMTLTEDQKSAFYNLVPAQPQLEPKEQVVQTPTIKHEPVLG
jgi:hypothetical protein